MEIFFVMITHLSREKEKKLCRVCGKIRIPYLVNQERSSVEIDQSQLPHGNQHKLQLLTKFIFLALRLPHKKAKNLRWVVSIQERLMLAQVWCLRATGLNPTASSILFSYTLHNNPAHCFQLSCTLAIYKLYPNQTKNYIQCISVHFPKCTLIQDRISNVINQVVSQTF